MLSWLCFAGLGLTCIPEIPSDAIIKIVVPCSPLSLVGFVKQANKKGRLLRDLEWWKVTQSGTIWEQKVSGNEMCMNHLSLLEIIR